MESQYIIAFLISIALGALIGTEREVSWVNAKNPGLPPGFGGIRTYSLLSLIGAVMTWFDIQNGGDLWKVVGAVIVFIIISISYTQSAFQKDAPGTTSEFAAILTYFIGIMVMSGQYLTGVILAILVLIILSAKEYIAKFRSKISRNELSNSLKFAVIALVVLPLLPDTKFAFSDILLLLWVTPAKPVLGACMDSFWGFLECLWYMKFFNPFSIWKFVVLMTAVEYAGYLLSKMVGSSAGIIASGAIGGLVSSTATTAAMSKKSIEDVRNMDSYILGTLVANSIMFIRVLVITALIAPGILATILFPALMMLLVFLGGILYFGYKWRQKHEGNEIEIEENLESPFQVLPAIKFAVFILFIKFISALIQLFQIKSLYIPFAIVSGLADVDAPTLEFATLGKDAKLSLFFAGMLILIAVMSNNTVKGTLAWRFGHVVFWRRVALVFALSAMAGLIVLLMMYFTSDVIVARFPMV